MRRTIAFTARPPKSACASMRSLLHRRPNKSPIPMQQQVQQRGVKLFAAAPPPYKADWENGPQDWHAWKKVLAETWYNFKQNVNRTAEVNRVYYPISKSLAFTWDQKEIEKVTPLSSLGRELFVGMNNWILNLKYLAWGRIDDPDYLDDFALLKSLYTNAKAEAQAIANDEQFKASWADWIEHCNSVSKSIYEDYVNDGKWRHEVDLHDEIIKTKLIDFAKGEEKDDADTSHLMTEVWHNPMEEGWGFRRQVLPRFPRSKFANFVPYDVQILDPLFAKIEFLHNMSLQVDQTSNIINNIGIKLQNTFSTSSTNDSEIALGLVETYQAMVASVESAEQQGIWNSEQAKYIKHKLFHEVLQEVDNLSDKGCFPSLRLRYPDIFR